MPRIEYKDFDDEQDRSDNVIKVKIPKPRNPAVRELFDGRFPPKRHKDKKREVSRFDKRNIESL